TAGVLLVAVIVLRVGLVHLLFGRWQLRDVLVKRRVTRDERFRTAYQEREKRLLSRGATPMPPPTGKETLLVGWTGMRGILTLAAAAATPETTDAGAPFPGRDSIQAIALLVTLGTLLIQGTTIGWLARRLRLDLTAERAEEQSQRELARQIIAET